MVSYFDEHDCQPLRDGEQPNHALHLARLLLDTGAAMEWDIEYSRIFGGERRTPPASKKVVETLPTEAISAAEAGRELKCPVCLAAFDEGEMANKLPCSHQFHSGCIVPWLQRVNSCPLCRHELPTDDEDYEAYKKHKARAKQREYEIESLHGSIDSKVSSNPPFKMFSSRRHPDLTKRRLDMLPGICYLESIMKNRTVKSENILESDEREICRIQHSTILSRR